MPAALRKTWTPEKKPAKRVVGLPAARILPRPGKVLPPAEAPPADEATPESLRAAVLARTGMDRPLAERKADQQRSVAALNMAAREAAAACNAMTLKWMGAHYVAGSAAQLTAPRADVQFSDAPLNLEIYHVARAAAPHLIPLNCAATFQWWGSTLREQTSPRDNVKRWRQVLRGAESVPHYGCEQPIRLAPNSVTVSVTDDVMIAECKVLRGEPPVRLEIKRPSRSPGGRNGKQYKQRWEAVAALTRVNGAMLVREGRGWSFRPVVERPAEWKLAAERGGTLFLRASARAPLVARLDGRSALLFAESVPVIENARLTLRAARSETPRRADGKPVGRNAKRETATKKWADTCATFSRQSVHYIAAWCEANGVSRIVFRSGDDACVLSCCGVDEQEIKREPSRFPYRQFAEFLQQKCQTIGIEVVYTPNLRSVKRRKALRALRLSGNRVRGAAV